VALAPVLEALGQIDRKVVAWWHESLLAKRRKRPVAAPPDPP
jgi:hypothetical protein